LITYGQTLLHIDNVGVDYDGKPILRNVNAEIKNITRTEAITGQVVGFLGLSGTGKTTLFRVIAGLEKPTSGHVYINGSTSPVEAGEVGVVAQSYPLFEHRTVFGNLLIAAQRKEKDLKIAKERVWEFLKEFELEDKSHLYPAQLSGGQRQRCAIGQQILNSEHFLLLDEPFSGLDVVMEEKTCNLLYRIAHRDDLNTLIVVTHDITAAATIADHIWVLGKEKGIEGSRIIKEYNLIERGLCWQPDIATSPALTEFVREVKEEFRTSR
jgi:ABC-type nitrate/sulfonate/bicarbonate transport system ATPase subunit